MLNIVDHGDVREISLDRPPVNALDPELVATLTNALETAARDAAAVVMSGREGLFSAGLDVPALLRLDRSAMGEFWTGFAGLLSTIARMPVPTAAAVTGHSPAGGAVMCLFMDYRVMARGEYRIGLNETQVGLSLPAFIHGALVRLVGPHRAERLVVSGELIPPDRALEAGLVDQLADDPASAVAAAVSWCEGLLRLPRHAMTANRRIMRASLTSLFDDVDPRDNDMFLDVWFSDETQGTLRALVESLRKK